MYIQKLKFFCSCFFIGIVFNVHAQQAALVSVDPVIQQPYTETVPVLGRLVAKRSGTVASRIAGSIELVNVTLGDRVKAGQVLAQIDRKVLTLQQQQARAQLIEAQSRLKTANAQLALAGQEVKRFEELQGSAAVSKAAYDDARQQKNIAFARVNEAEAGINSGRATLDIAELALSFTDIIAPFDGTITEKLVEVGNYLQQGQSVFHIISDNQLELEADIPAALLDGLTNSVIVTVMLENGTQHSATLRAIIPEENPRTRTRSVRFNTELNEDAGILATQQSATIMIPASTARDILTVHKDGITRKGQNNTVFIVVEDAVELRVIETGDSVGQRVEVLAGIKQGDVVVIRGNERLKPGQTVQIGQTQ